MHAHTAHQQEKLNWDPFTWPRPLERFLLALESRRLRARLCNYSAASSLPSSSYHPTSNASLGVSARGRLGSGWT